LTPSLRQAERDLQLPQASTLVDPASVQVRDEVRNTLVYLAAKGIKDWEIPNVWAEIA
jgi:hypothetical protein